MTGESEQQTARVNIGDELRRSRKRKRRTDEDATSADGVTLEGPANEPAHPIRLADAELLTELPRPDESPRRSL